MSHAQINSLKQRGCAFSLALYDSGADLFKSSYEVMRKLLTDDKDVVFVAVIKHSLDWDDDEKRFKTPHYHVVVTFEHVYKVETILNWFSCLFHANKNQIQIEKCNSVCMQVRYLIHLDDFDKHMYSKYDISTNDKGYVETCLNMIRKITDVNDLFTIMTEFPNLQDLIRAIGIENYKKYRVVIQDVRRSIYG